MEAGGEKPDSQSRKYKNVTRLEEKTRNKRENDAGTKAHEETRRTREDTDLIIRHKRNKTQES